MPKSVILRRRIAAVGLFAAQPAEAAGDVVIGIHGVVKRRYWRAPANGDT